MWVCSLNHTLCHTPGLTALNFRYHSWQTLNRNLPGDSYRLVLRIKIPKSPPWYTFPRKKATSSHRDGSFPYKAIDKIFTTSSVNDVAYTVTVKDERCLYTMVIQVQICILVKDGWSQKAMSSCITNDHFQSLYPFYYLCTVWGSHYFTSFLYFGYAGVTHRV